MRHLSRSLLAVALAGTLLGACASDDDGDDGASTTTEAPAATTAPTTTEAAPPTTSPVAVEPNGETVTIKAVDNTFVPEETTVAAGTEVIWENRGRNDHTVIAETDDAPWTIDTEDFAPGDSGSYTFTHAGTYRFYCSIHGTLTAGMPGVLIVE